MKLTSIRPSFFAKANKRKTKNKSRELTSRSDPPSFGSIDSAASSSDGLISADEQPISKQNLEAVLRRLDVTEDELATMLAEGHAGNYDAIQMERADENELREAFGVFDADGNGRISAEELHEMLVMLGDEHCTLAECRRMIRLVDRVGDGFVCFSDFVRMMGSDCR